MLKAQQYQANAVAKKNEAFENIKKWYANQIRVLVGTMDRDYYLFKKQYFDNVVGLSPEQRKYLNDILLRDYQRYSVEEHIPQFLSDFVVRFSFFHMTPYFLQRSFNEKLLIKIFNIFE